MSVLFDPHEVGINGQSNLRKGARPPRRKEDDLLVFGYACKLFENNQTAASFDEEKSLIPWMGDESLLIDRYDARLLFTDKAQFVSKPSQTPPVLTPEEEEMERRFDEERYLDLHHDTQEYELQQEEEMKRFQQALSEDGAYNSVAFSYDYSAPENSFHYPQSVSSYETTSREGTLLYQARQANSSVAQSAREEMVSPSPKLPQPHPVQQPEPFVPPEDLEIPSDMEIPETAKMQAIIERTAVFVAKQGKQMEILVKAKQSGNPQFDFLLIDNWLNPYYQHVLKYIMEGKYNPVIPKQPSPEPQPEAQESESEDESDGEYELHPLLAASLHKKVTRPRSQPSSASSSPLPDTLGNKFSRTFAPVAIGSSSVSATQDNGSTHDLQNYSETDESYDYSMWYSQDMYAQYGSTSGYTYLPPVTPVLSVADMIPPPPPPPGEGPLEEEWLDSTSSVPPLPPPPPPPAPPGIFVPSSVEMSGPVAPPPPPPGVSTVALVSEQIIPPPPDLQPIVDKLANYVAKNGPDFEEIIKAKNDPRFEFLNPWNSHYSYFQLKKQQAVEAARQRRETENDKIRVEVPKGPISFSIKAKDVKKPKIEYRTSVIYKQSYEQGQSDEDADDAETETDTKEISQASGEKEDVNKLSESSFSQDTSQQSTEDLNQQMDSIKAAERIAQHLESESRDKQLQLERRRKASLFISMLKKTNPGDELEANESAPESQVHTGKTRKFVESKGEKRSDSPTAKRSRVDDDSDDESISRGGLGMPPPDSIRVTQDLMAKVLAASRNK
ncbi:splicing factor, suppressor of white-apricot homolog isoform X2 [Pocillopora verrucosa]|uniref:splicing factor, suppressor of white-apricot homolog isoform X2 n=1 Tax=Pocillopora verrucosa TaxID=203993 RepID=UPI002797A3BF|nr:splicing factor, suppressor of white-apricot homolog isoform X2 [Pocillopora verrucosa]